MHYRKKPVVIEAFKLDLSDGATDPPQWFNDAILSGVVRIIGYGTPHAFARIETLKRSVSVANGDWIIKHANGGLDQCRDDIFQATYEQVGRVLDAAAFGARP